MESVGSTLLFSCLAGLGSLTGTGLIVRGRDRLSGNLPLVVSYAAGTLMGVAFFDLLPEAHSLIGVQVFPWILLSFVAFFFLESTLHIHHHHEHDLMTHSGPLGVRPDPVGFITFVGMGVHSLIDGLIIGVGFGVSPALGLLTTLGLLAHELPQGIAIASVLLHANYSARRTTLFASLVALATPVGGVAAVLLTRHLRHGAIGTLLAFAAGTFLYVALSDLIPEAHKSRRFATGVLLLLGVLTIFGLMHFLNF